jgi:hypothetical protein
VKEVNKQETSQLHWNQLESRNETTATPNPNWHDRSPKHSAEGREAGTEKERSKGKGLGGLEIVFDPFVPAPIFVMERRRMRAALVVIRDGAENLGNKAEGSA